MSKSISSCKSKNFTFSKFISRIRNAESVVFLLLFAGVLWLVAHPYRGIYHDSIIYSLIAARWLNPEGFAKDLFFMFGSQDDFNFYTPIFATLVSSVGLDFASRIVVIFGGCLWIAAFYSLSIKIIKDFRPVSFILFVAAVATWSYSPNFSTFEVNEPFATARVLAMPIALLGLSAGVSGRNIIAFGLTLFSTALHPLIGIWAFILVVCSKWPPAVVAFGALASFITLLVIPFLFQIGSLSLMNQKWLDMVKYSSMDVFFGDLSVLNIEKFIYCMLALYIGISRGQAFMRPMYRVLALMLTSLYLLSLVISYYFPVVFILQAQPWRVMWLAMAIGLIACVDGLWMVLQRGKSALLLGCIFALVVFALERYQVYLLPVLVFAITREGILVRLLSGMTWLLEKKILFLIIVSTLTLMLVPRYLLDVEILGVAKFGAEWLAISPSLRGFFFEGGLGLGFLLLSVAITIKSVRVVGWLVLLPLFYFGFANWDQRTKERINEESHYISKGWVNPFSRYVVPGEVVVWPGADLRVWFELGTANYANSTQAVGIVFSEKKAIEVKNRLIQLVAASTTIATDFPIKPSIIWDVYKSNLINNGEDPRNIHKARPSAVTMPGLQYLCRTGDVDWVVMDEKNVDFVNVSYVASYSDALVTWYLVKCG